MVWIPVAIAITAVVIGLREVSFREVAYVGAALVLVVAAMTVRRNLAGKAPMTLTARGIELSDGVTIPWENLDDVGEAHVRGAIGWGKGFGLRVKSRKRLEDSRKGRPITLQSRDFSGGWDMTWPASQLPGSPSEVEEKVRTYWERARPPRQKK